jgi:hypothetical protein
MIPHPEPTYAWVNPQTDARMSVKFPTIQDANEHVVRGCVLMRCDAGEWTPVAGPPSEASVLGFDPDTLVDTSVTWCHAIYRALSGGPAQRVATRLRDDFLQEWQVTPERWNQSVDRLIEYAGRKGETPEVTTYQLLAIRCQIYE